MNLPIALTLLRIFVVPLLVAVLVDRGLSLHWNGNIWLDNDLCALAIFVFASATDLLDGYLARKWGQVTSIGILLDPIADKLLISAALIALVEVHRIPAWMVILLVGRDFAVSGLRSIAATEGYTIQASELGKTKMVSQVVGVALTLLSIRWRGLAPAANLCIWGAMIFSLASAAQYFGKFWKVLDESRKPPRGKTTREAVPPVWAAQPAPARPKSEPRIY